MRVLTGQVVDGKIEVPSDLENGSRVAVLAPGPDTPTLSPADEEELLDAWREIRAGDYVDGWELLDEIRSTNRR